jgi:sugar lactone lactonase YvrE
MLRHSLGRILAFDLKTHTATVLLKDIAFPNGIVYEKKTNSIIYSELTRMTIWKYKISTGRKTVLI